NEPGRGSALGGVAVQTLIVGVGGVAVARDRGVRLHDPEQIAGLATRPGLFENLQGRGAEEVVRPVRAGIRTLGLGGAGVLGAVARRGSELLLRLGLAVRRGRPPVRSAVAETLEGEPSLTEDELPRLDARVDDA